MEHKIPSPEELAAIKELATRYPWLLPQPEPDRTVRQVVVAYLDAVQTTLAPTTIAYRAPILDLLLTTFGDRQLRDCNPIDLEAWIKAQSWGPHYRHSANCVSSAVR